MEIREILAVIRAELPSKISELAASIDLLRIALAGVKAEATSLTKAYMENAEFSKGRTLYGLVEGIHEVDKLLDEYVDLLEISSPSDESVEENDSHDLADIVDNGSGEVNYGVAYSLYENFTHTKPYGFKLKEGPLHQVRTWKQMAADLYQKLDELKPGVLDTLPAKEALNGRTNAYFASTPDNMRTPVAITDTMFLEGNQSANAFRNLMHKVLLEFGFKATDIRIYLRGDASNTVSHR